jgi:hypothetical protein
MWFFFLRRLRLFLLAAVLLPVVASIARRLAERLEQRGTGAGSRGLRLVESSALRARAVLR